MSCLVSRFIYPPLEDGLSVIPAQGLGITLTVYHSRIRCQEKLITKLAYIVERIIPIYCGINIVKVLYLVSVFQ